MPAIGIAAMVSGIKVKALIDCELGIEYGYTYASDCDRGRCYEWSFKSFRAGGLVFPGTW